MLGIDFGGTKIKLVEVQGADIIRTESVDTPPRATPTNVLDTIGKAVTEFEASPKTLGLAIPGEVDAKGICWRLPNVPGFEGVAIAKELEDRTGARVTVENDGAAAALAESKFGHGRSHASFVMITLGTGIGGGLAIDGQVIRGANGFAAEIGHIMVDSSPDAWPCGCGQKGCVESYAGTGGLLRRFEELGGSASEIAEVADSARSGDDAGKQVFQEMASALSIMLTSVQNLLDLNALVFTGGISKSFDLIEPSLRAAMRQRGYAKPLVEVPLLVSEMGDRAGAVGAAYLPEAFGSG